MLLGGNGTFWESDVLELSYVTGDVFLKETFDLSSLSLPAGCHRWTDPLLSTLQWYNPHLTLKQRIQLIVDEHVQNHEPK